MLKFTASSCICCFRSSNICCFSFSAWHDGTMRRGLKMIKIYWDILRWYQDNPRHDIFRLILPVVFDQKTGWFRIAPTRVDAYAKSKKITDGTHSTHTHKHTHSITHSFPVYPPIVGDSPFQLLCQCCSLTVRFKKLWIEHHGGHGVQKRGQKFKIICEKH